MIRCHACDLALDHDDNYCRKCGAPIRVVQPAELHQHTEIVRIGPAAPAIIAGVAKPVATGAAAVAAGALMRFAVKRAVRGLIGGAAAPRAAPEPRALTRREDAPVERRDAQGRTIQVTEVYWYRRIVRS